MYNNALHIYYIYVVCICKLYIKLYLAEDAESQSVKLIFHWNLCLAISKRPEPL